MLSLRICLWVLLAQALLLLGGCGASKIFTVKDLDMMSAEERTMEILRNPEVNDLYVVDITQFSIYPFQFEGMSPDAEKADATQGTTSSATANYTSEDVAFGMLRVMKINPESVTLVTEYSAWPKTPEGALDDLRGDLSNIAWHGGEEIVIRIAALKQLLESGAIIEARRLSEDKARAVLSRPK